MSNKLKRKASSAKSIIPFANRQTQQGAETVERKIRC